MVFTTQENQAAIVRLMELIDGMHRHVDISLAQADKAEIAITFMMQYLFANKGDNVVMPYDLANKLSRVDNGPFKQLCVRLMPFDIVVTRIRVTDTGSVVFSVVSHDGSSVMYDDFQTLLEAEHICSWTEYSYIRATFAMGWRWVNTLTYAYSWYDSIIKKSWRDYYGDHDFIFGKLYPAVTEFIDKVHAEISLQDIMQLIESLH